MTTTFREVCGGLRGMLAHQAAGEKPCGWCAQAERAALLAAEACQPVPGMPTGSGGVYLPVTDMEASVNRAVLEAEVIAYERDHPEGTGSNAKRGHLRRVA